MALRRDIAPFLQRVRAFLLGREHTVALRFEDGLADRTQPPPDIPGGPAHILSANYYANRDARREVKPPIDLMQEKIALQSEASGKTAPSGKAAPPVSKLPTPGQIYRWD